MLAYARSTKDKKKLYLLSGDYERYGIIGTMTDNITIK